jgi:hypothetical protein
MIKSLLVPALIGTVLMIGLLHLQSCGCDDPNEEYISSIGILLKDGALYAFQADSTRKSLTITKISTGQKVNVDFDLLGTSDGEHFGFRITDPEHDTRSIQDLVCDDYIVKYGVNDIDTLRVCTNLGHDGRCETYNLKKVEVYLNGTLGNYAYHVATISK